MTDFLEDDSEDNEETEVERPKHPPKPRETPNPEPVILNVPELPDARRGNSGGNGNLVSPMPDYTEPKKVQLQNDREIESAFSNHRARGNVIPIRPDMPNAAPSVPPAASVASPPVSAPAARSAPPVAAPSRAVQSAQRAAYEAQVQARRASEAAAQAFAEADALESEPEVRRIPVQKKSKPFVLLGVAAAALFGAVAFSMWETYSKAPPEQEGDEDEEEEEIVLEPVSLESVGDVVDGEIVEEEVA